MRRILFVFLCLWPFLLPVGTVAADITLTWNDTNAGTCRTEIYYAEMTTNQTTAFQFNQIVDAGLTTATVVGLDDTKTFVFQTYAVDALGQRSLGSNLAWEIVEPQPITGLGTQ